MGVALRKSERGQRAYHAGLAAEGIVNGTICVAGKRLQHDVGVVGMVKLT